MEPSGTGKGDSKSGEKRQILAWKVWRRAYSGPASQAQAAPIDRRQRTPHSNHEPAPVPQFGPDLLLCGAMDYLWTPWRYAYVTTAAKVSGCIFDELPKLPDQEANIVHRGKHCFVVLNTYPYTPGHVMVVPYAHLDQLDKLPLQTAHEMIDLCQMMERILRQLYSPDGVNLGMNIGRAAGAGVVGHIHMHVLPRWVGDSNFMTVVAESRTLPETLEMTYQRVKGAFESAAST
jgi:ATP adenylyltransferase